MAAVKEAEFKRFNGTEWETVRFPPAPHTHTVSDITDMPDGLATQTWVNNQIAAAITTALNTAV